MNSYFDLPPDKRHRVLLLPPTRIAPNLDALVLDLGRQFREVRSNTTLSHGCRDENSVSSFALRIRESGQKRRLQPIDQLFNYSRGQHKHPSAHLVDVHRRGTPGRM